MPYKIIDDRTKQELRPRRRYDGLNAAWREITEMQNRWDEHGGDSGFTRDQLVHAKPVEVPE